MSARLRTTLPGRRRLPSLPRTCVPRASAIRPTRRHTRGQAPRAGSGCRAAPRNSAVVLLRHDAAASPPPGIFPSTPTRRARTPPRRRRKSYCSSCKRSAWNARSRRWTEARAAWRSAWVVSAQWRPRIARRADHPANPGLRFSRCMRDSRRATDPRTAPVRRWLRRSMWLQKSSLRATTISAAAEGVGARTSAAKSAMVKSTSWPTAEIIGTGEATMALATPSSLNAHKSSTEPPPRPTMTTSIPVTFTMSRIARATSAAAPSPWTRAGRITRCAFG